MDKRLYLFFCLLVLGLLLLGNGLIIKAEYIQEELNLQNPISENNNDSSIQNQQWAITLENTLTGTEYVNSILEISGGGYVIAGEFFGDFGVVKIDSYGNIVWQKRYGGPYDEFANSIQETSDGGFIVAGNTYSFGVAYQDYWVLKLDSSGNIEWQKSYGGEGSDLANSAQQTSDGGYIVAGSTAQIVFKGSDILILKLDQNGDIEWQKSIGGISSHSASSIHQTPDGGYIVAGHLDVTGADADFWILKLDASGNIEWQKSYGGEDFDYFPSLSLTEDGGYILSGLSSSFGAGETDYWILKLDSVGNVVWQKTYGGSNYDGAESIQQTSDGGYIVAGRTFSFGVTNSNVWLIKLDSVGNVVWQKAYRGTYGVSVNTVQQTSDGGYIAAGSTGTETGLPDILILKLDSNGEIAGCDLVDDTNATVTNTSISGVNTSALVQNTNVTLSDTNDSPIITSATSNFFCSVPPPPTPTPLPTVTPDCNDMTDDDEDGLPYGYEKCGYDYNEDGSYSINTDGNPDVNLPAMGADPDKPDIFIEVDYMESDGICIPHIGCYLGHSHQPKSGAISAVIEAFSNQGINLHVDYGPNGVMNPVTGQKWGDLSEADAVPHFDKIGSSCGEDCYSWYRFPVPYCDELEDLTEIYFDDIKTCYFSWARRPAFHYVVFAHQLGGFGCTSGISRDAPASDFIVSLGGWGDNEKLHCEDFRAIRLVGTETQQGGIFMHELGHNLGLCHGGPIGLANPDDQCEVYFRPNYLSIMNYAYSTRGLIIDGKTGHIDYSNFMSSDLNLNEVELNETVGLKDTTVITEKYGTRYWCNVNIERIDYSIGAIDWNCDGDEEDNPLFLENINEGPDGDYHDTIFSELKSYKDWGNLDFIGGAIGDFGIGGSNLPTETLGDELSKEEDDVLTTDYGVAVTGLGNAAYLAGSSNTYTITVTNLGVNSDTYYLTVTSSFEWADLEDIPISLTLPPETSITLLITLNIPLSASPGISDELIFLAVSQNNPLVKDSTVIIASVIYKLFLPVTMTGD